MTQGTKMKKFNCALCVNLILHNNQNAYDVSKLFHKMYRDNLQMSRPTIYIYNFSSSDLTIQCSADFQFVFSEK